ncbi:MAG: helix-turn-helix domain-containing protein [Planctomycetaceae bacterium]
MLQIFLLDKTKRRARWFEPLHPQRVSSIGQVRKSLLRASRNSLWISYEENLTNALLHSVRRPAKPLGSALLLHPPTLESVPVLAGSFDQVAFSTSQEGFLPPEELAEALSADNRDSLFIGGSVDPNSETITLWRGNLDPITVPFSAFPASGDGIKPDFSAFSVTDYGHTIRLGDYEAAADAVLYEFDPAYRRRLSKLRRESEKSFGASLRRLRMQRGLSRDDFSPLSPKTIARIEQGKVQRIHNRTLSVLATTLAVEPEDIETF